MRDNDDKPSSILGAILAGLVENGGSARDAIVVGEALVRSAHHCDEAREATIKMFLKKKRHDHIDMISMVIALLEEANAIMLAIEVPPHVISALVALAEVLRTHPETIEKTKALGDALVDRLLSIDEQVAREESVKSEKGWN